MSYDYKETSDEIIINKGIATREMWKEYDHGKEHVSFEELERACQIRPTVPIVLDTRHDHNQPLTDASKAVGAATLRPCPEKRGLTTTWHLYKRHLPEDLLETIRQRKPLPVSIYQFVNVDDREQRDLLFDHIAILSKDDPRCPIERCGVGVYDSKAPQDVPEDEYGDMIKLTEEKKPEVKAPEPTTDESTAVPTTPSDQKETKEPPLPKVEVEPEPVVPDALQTKDQEISALKAQLDKAKEQIKAVRQPLVDALTQRGYQLQELNPLSMTTLQKMVQEARAASTEGLPGTVPAPSATTPATLAEAREKEQQRFETELKKRQEERFKDW